jgi:hypothetical protein
MSLSVEQLEAKRAYNREYQRRWRLEHPDRVKASQKKWCENNTLKRRASIKKWRAENKERRNEYQRGWYARNPHKIKEYHENQKRNNPESVKASVIKTGLKRFNLTVREYNAMLEKQGHVCAICGEKNKNGRRLSIDHCHASGFVRGILCNNCNAGIGYFKEDQHLLNAAITYLVKN